MANMDKIDIPTYFVMGLRDSLIQPASILKLYDAMHVYRPDLAHLKVNSSHLLAERFRPFQKWAT